MAAASRWCAAGGRRRRRRKAEEESGAAVLRRLRDARDELLSSGFWEASAGVVRGPLDAGRAWRCVCYGLGRFAACPTARLQLAFLLLLLEMLAVPPSHCFLFDPAFSELELAALEALGLCLLPENEALYNNLLWRNWSVGALSNMVIIGNSFKGIEERLPSRILERDYSYIAKILEGVEEVVLPTHPRYSDTFNDTSIHWFPAHKLEGLPAEVWEFVEEPTYEECDDLEIIRKGEEGSQHSPATAQL
ncbi:SRR1-like protein isoform X2 [Cyrtonyx montezumae]|uniref:SRR1-like protein isoform X2 n=1 Tax=Cyrtonyx montezumae TaxID=9017 RepID=UPI0032DA6EEE